LMTNSPVEPSISSDVISRNEVTRAAEEPDYATKTQSRAKPKISLWTLRALVGEKEFSARAESDSQPRVLPDMIVSHCRLANSKQEG
jgi:hypothetical protein